MPEKIDSRTTKYSNNMKFHATTIIILSRKEKKKKIPNLKIPESNEHKTKRTCHRAASCRLKTPINPLKGALHLRAAAVGARSGYPGHWRLPRRGIKSENSMKPHGLRSPGASRPDGFGNHSRTLSIFPALSIKEPHCCRRDLERRGHVMTGYSSMASLFFFNFPYPSLFLAAAAGVDLMTVE